MKIKLTLFMLFMGIFMHSQSFKEVQLPTPDKMSSFFIGPLIKSTIHYGATPPNYNGKVILFNHGYIDLNQTHFLFNNSFYQETYNEGYQAVFVATTRGEGLWENGELLAESIDNITEKYRVPSLYIIAHSNGGKASEAAMYRYGKKDKVKKVFALGTPYWGTYLADISQFPLLNWAWRLTGLNEGSRTSTTYYCRDVVRPYFDNHPDNEPEKFVVLGASGFYNGSTILAPVFLATGGILLPVQGANDGVAPYQSTLRPGAEYVFSERDPEAIFDHLDVALGQFTWGYIKDRIENNQDRRSFKEEKSLSNDNQLESDYYILQSENSYDRISLDKDSKYAIAQILHENKQAKFKALDKHNKQISYVKTHTNDLHNTVITVEEDNVDIQSNSKYVAFVKQEKGIVMTFRNYDQKKLEVGFKNAAQKELNIDQVNVRGVLVKTTNIDGSKVASQREIIIEFDKKGKKYSFETTSLDDGVYSLFLNSSKENDFKRSLITGFVIGKYNESINTIREDKELLENNNVQLYPTVIENKATILLKKNEGKEVNVKIYDVTGKLMKNFVKKRNTSQVYEVSEKLQSLQAGIYLLKINNEEIIKFVKK